MAYKKKIQVIRPGTGETQHRGMYGGTMNISRDFGQVKPRHKFTPRGDTYPQERDPDAGPTSIRYRRLGPSASQQPHMPKAKKQYNVGKPGPGQV